MSHMPPPPPTLGYAPPPPAGTDLRTVAVRQRNVMLAILTYFLAVIIQFVLPPELQIVPALLGLAASLCGAVFVFMLAMSLYSTGVGILLGILTLVPLVGLIVLLVINSKATTLLRHHGIQVGLLGASPSQIPSAGNVPPR